MNKKRRLSLLAGLMGASLLVVAFVAMGTLHTVPQFIRDQIRRYHINKYSQILREQSLRGPLPTTASYGKDDGFGWDFSYVNPNRNGVYFLDFLGKKENAMVDPLNNATGNITCNAGRCGGSGYTYFYFCYKIEKPCDKFAPKSWWGRTGCDDFALIGARLEIDDGIYYRRIDNVICQ